MTKKLKILVIGNTATGKTTISKLIAETLANVDLDVVLVDDGFDVEEDDKHWSKTNAALESLKGQLEVEIKTVQARRKPIEE